MPLVTCPRCAASVYAIAAGENVGIMGAADLKRCERVRHNERTKSGVDLLLACAEMRKAMEAEIGPIFDYSEERAGDQGHCGPSIWASSARRRRRPAKDHRRRSSFRRRPPSICS